MTKRTIRRAQALYPYGPGAILDWGQECFIVLDTHSPGWRHGPKIRLQRLEKRLRVADGFRLPPVHKDRSRPNPLDVQRFPAWLFCPRCRSMWRWDRQRELVAEGRLPKCLSPECSRSVLVPMRYVAVCEEGHIADVDWFRWAHSRSQSSPCDRRDPSLKFLSRADKGATLESLSVKCHICGQGRDLKEILNPHVLASIGQKCWGRQPWQAREREVACDKHLRVLQRSQTAVHYADSVSAIDLTVEEAEAEQGLGEVLEALISALAISDLAEALEQAQMMAKTATRKLEEEVTQPTVENWLRRHFATSQLADDSALSNDASEEEILREELPALTTVLAQTSKRAPLVVTSEQNPLPEHLSAVFLIERLREVRAFRGFRRIRPDATLVPPDLGALPAQSWLPAIEVYGEGIFLEFSVDAIKRWERSQAGALEQRLRKIIGRLAAADGPVKRFSAIQSIAARFILLHTFAHVFMRQLCYECGYGGASLRERLYVFDDRAGVLIYTADGDSEGSLGGLVRHGRFDRLGGILVSALQRASWCSNDPICTELPEHGFGQLNRASCHACALAPETSCTHLNALLDRELLIGSGDETGVKGFFTDLLQASLSAE